MKIQVNLFLSLLLAIVASSVLFSIVVSVHFSNLFSQNLLATLPEAQLQQLSKSTRLSMLLTFLTVFASSLVFCVFLLKTYILSPVKMLALITSDASGVGDIQTVDLAGTDVRRFGEIEDLAHSIFRRAEKLSATQQQLEQSLTEIDSLKSTDYLTGLPNRRVFLERVAKLIQKPDDPSTKAAVLFLNLDDFRRLNDTLGHETGDILLQEVASRLVARSATYHSSDKDALVHYPEQLDTVARLGGDEFAIVIKNLIDPMDAAQIAETVLLALRQPVRLKGKDYVLTASIGISSFPDSAQDVESLMACADTAMFEVKKREKDGYRFFGKSMNLGTQERVSMERDLRIAVECEAFELNYQPQFDTRTQTLVGVEALLRWHHPVRGNVPPDKFIGIAEDIGLIGSLGEWVIDEACRQWAQWNAAGNAPPRIAVNVSLRQFSLSYLPDVVANAIKKHNIPAEVLEVEITESCMMEAPSDVMQSLNIIRDSGVRIAMDDFGTGYSSLSSLSSLPIDILKIDRSFVTGVEPGKPNETIVSAIVSLAHSLKLEIVAEGVETQSDYQYLLGKGCEICQGYLFSRPLAVQQMDALLAGGDEAQLAS